MRKALEIVNELKEKGIIKDYAIGGGVASINYTEPVFTRDLDVFVIVKDTGGVLRFSEIYDYVKKRGGAWKGEHLFVSNTPVQFLPANSGLYKDAVLNAKEIDYDEMKVRIISAEHLIAMSFAVGRSKDYERIDRIIDQYTVDFKVLESILKRHNLYDKYESWKKNRN